MRRPQSVYAKIQPLETIGMITANSDFDWKRLNHETRENVALNILCFRECE